jgi:hypothetical protein
MPLLVLTRPRWLHKEDPKTTHNCPGRNIVKGDEISLIFQQLSQTNPGDHLADHNAAITQIVVS